VKGTSWLLGGGYPWPAAKVAHTPGARSATVTDPELGLSLCALPTGPFGLESGDGSLGRLTLPLGVAVAEGRVFLLSSDGARVFAYDSEHRCLRALANVGADGLAPDAPASAYTDPRRFRGAVNIAAFGKLLYVADPAAHRVQVFDWTNGALVRIHGGLVAPIDVAAGRRGVYVLDAARGRVYLARPHRGTLTLVASIPERARRWTRLAVDRDDRLYLRDIEAALADCEPDRAVLDVVIPSCRRPAHCVSERIGDAGAVRSRFDEPPVWSSTGAASELSLRDDRAADVRIARDGRVSPARHDGLPDLRRTYERAGIWISDWLDSDIYQCQWHLVELAIAALPPGARITVRTRTSNAPPALDETRLSLESLAASRGWSESLAIDAPAQPTDAELERAKHQDLLVQSGPGQYLQLLVELASDGIATPRIARLRLRFPYSSLRELLPALYSAPEEQRRFLDRYLGVVQRTWDDIEHTVTAFERFLDADTVPEGAPMRYLASWLGVKLEGTWTADQNRRLFGATRDALPHWGTPDALRKWIAAHLENLSGVPAADIHALGVPGIVEGFVERRRLMLGREDTARLGSAEPLWGPAVERRLQIGVYDREGDVELVSVGDPTLDVFQHSAHRFRVYVPSAWVRTAAQEALLRRAIDAQTPAHTSYELVLVAPRFRVGVQSTVALDTVVGAPLTSGLACSTDDEPASRPPHERLGFDLVLGAGRNDAALGGTELILA
jgi:phage tail-like protein